MIVESKVNQLLSRWEAEEYRPSPEELCADCPELLPQVRDCISRLRSTDRHLKDDGTEAPKPPEIPGYDIDPQPIGRGGMGIVWKAIRLGTHRTIALKVIGAGDFASPRARARFEREVELASRLNHPNIARVYDSGIHTGLFYYAMELVEGVRLDRHVESKQLNRRQILELMQPICAAVQHAHQLGVIHRDLKPSNILVDAAGQPHLLDFGLAKEVWSETSPQITLEDAPGTPAYMSPEQASGQYKRVGTASDVYTLGVILYLLLLKRYPHDVEGTSIEVMNRVATQEPARPRAVDPGFPRDLEAILLKALAREPEERYPSADALSADIQCWLDGRPITPLRHNWRYVAGKLIRRHKYKLVTAGAVFAVILTVTIVAYVNVARQRDRAETEAQISKAVNEFLLNMLAAADPEASGTPVPTLPEMLDRAAAKIDGAFPKQPLVEAAIRSTIGNTYVLLGSSQKAEPHIRAALALRARELGPEHPDTLATLGHLAFVLSNDNRDAEAERILRPALDAARKTLGDTDECTLGLIQHLGTAMYYQMRYAEAEQLSREVYETCQRVYGPENLETIAASEMLANALSSGGKYDQAERLLLDAMARYPADPQIRVPRLCHSYLSLGGTLGAQGKLTEAEAAFTRCVELRTHLYGSDHGMVSYAKYRLAMIKERLGKLGEAEQLTRESLAVDESQRLGSSRLIEQYLTLARVCRSQGRPDEAKPLIDRARVLADYKLTATNPPDLKALRDYGDGLIRLGMNEQAVEYLTRAVEIAAKSLPPDHAGLRQVIATLDRACGASTLPTTAPLR